MHLRWPIVLSILAALATIGMKTTAYALTGSVGLLSDALESGVNLFAAVVAYLSLVYAARPADPTHTYGHEKIEYLSSGLEGALILAAGLGTAGYAIRRMIHPQPLADLEVGAAIALAASAVNLVVARILLHYGRKHRSIVLEADGKHLMSDVWTSVGVVAGLALVVLTNLTLLDALIAIAVGLNISWSGYELIRRSFDGLMDHALPDADRERIREVIQASLPAGAAFHGLRTRQAGARRFAEFHLLVDGDLPVREAHHLAHVVEEALVAALPGLEVVTHLEPVDEESSWEPEYLKQLGEESTPGAERRSPVTLDAILTALDTSAVRTVAVGAAGLGLVAGAIGSFAVLRRQSLQGDVVSHAALPGLAAAFLLGAREPVALILGGAVSGWLAMLTVAAVKRRSRVPLDAALGGALAVFFGLGLLLMTYIQRHVPDASRHPLDRYLFGQAALLRDDDLNVIFGFGAVALALLALFWKEFKLLSFDPDYAASLGYRVPLLDLLLTTLTVTAVVIGLKAVGVVLMTALLIAPAAAARQWTNRLGGVVLLAGLFGALAGAGGTAFSHLAGAGVPTGPTIVLAATALVLVSLVFGPARGLVWKLRRPPLAA